MDTNTLLQRLHEGDPRAVGRAVSLVEDNAGEAGELLKGLDRKRFDQALVIGITGPPGAGKSTLTGALTRLLRRQGSRVGVIGIDPSSPISGGALLGDRIRMMDHALDPDVLVRSMATRGRLGGICASAGAAVRILAAGGCATILIETVGIGQSEMDIIRLADLTLMVLAPGFGDDIQAMKAGILEVADLLVVNKADLPGADRLRLDLAAVFTDAAERDLRLLETVAGEDQGVETLLERITMLADRYREDGTMAARRRNAHVLEAVDWALEMLRPRLTDLAGQAERTPDPRLAAEQILARFKTGTKA